LAAATSYKGSSTLGGPPNQSAPRLRFETKQGLLPPSEASALLKTHGISEPKYAVVRVDGDVLKMRGVKFPVACKLLSPDLVHKTDVGGVVVGVENIEGVQKTLARFRKVAQAKEFRFGGMMVQEMVKGGVELLLGGARDPVFGPVVVVGIGGTYAELAGDHAIGIAPVTETEAKEVLGQSKVSRILEGYRGGPTARIENLARVISSFSTILSGQNSIEELEINPLMVTGSGVLAVDMRVIVRRPPKS
jgi:succinyl-CoA synthetase beta subunit